MFAREKKQKEVMEKTEKKKRIRGERMQPVSNKNNFLGVGKLVWTVRISWNYCN